MTHPAIKLIEERYSANRFDNTFNLDTPEIEDLVRLATSAPSAYNLQNWRFIAVRSKMEKSRLTDLAYGQRKVSDAAVTFIVVGQLPNHTALPQRLHPFVDSGHMPQAMAREWQDAVQTGYSDPVMARDEAIRSATLAATTMMIAAAAKGLVSGPMVGFDAKAVSDSYHLANDELPVMLLAIGRAAQGNWPQKPRRPLTEVLKVQ
jgi:nitroreductase